MRLAENTEKWDNDLPSLWLQIMMDEIVNKARSWDKSPDIKILIFSGLGRN